MNNHQVIRDAEEYDLESLENILLGWPTRIRTKLNRSAKTGSGRRPPRVARPARNNVGEENSKKKKESLKLIANPPILTPAATKAEEFVLDEKRAPRVRHPSRPINRPHHQATRLRTVSILDTLAELIRGPNDNGRAHVPDLDILATTNRRGGKNSTCRPVPADGDTKCTRRMPIARGQTPDWIKGVFDLVKNGQADKLLLTLKEMDAILVRNLSDHHGNNLFHACASSGQVECLKILLEQGAECEEALYDENKRGLTPIVLGVKNGHVAFLKCLVERPDIRDSLLSPGDSRPLLHWAAKYGQEAVIRWLLSFMRNHEINVNLRDQEGNTALHIASKCGHIPSIKVLVEYDADMSLQNHLGHKPADTARLYGHEICFEYLMAVETCLLLAYDVSSAEEDLHNIRLESHELRNQFREVLSCAKKSLKEKEDLGLEMEMLRNQAAQINEHLVSQVQSLIRENAALREKINGGRKKDGLEEQLHSALERSRMLYQEWQEGHKRWFSKSSLTERDSRLLIAEDNWRRVRSRMNRTNKPCRQPNTIFSERLRQVYCRSAGVNLGEIGNLSSSESSLSSIGTAEADSEHSALTTSAKLIKPRGSETATKINTRRQYRRRSAEIGELKRVSSAPNIPGPAVPLSRASPSLVKLLGELTVSNLGPPLSTFADPDDVTCTVLEVIEPLSNDGRKEKQSEKQSSSCSTNVEDVRSYSIAGSSKGESKEVLQNESLSTNKENVDLPQTEDARVVSSTRVECVSVTKSVHESNEDILEKTGSQSSMLSSEPDLIKETKGIRAWEAAVATTSSETPSEETSDIFPWMPDDSFEGLPTNGVPPVPRPRLARCPEGFPCSPSKRKGFLHKFALRWPSKRKEVKSTKKNQEITPEDFRETYLSRSNSESVGSLNMSSICEDDSVELQVGAGKLSDTIEIDRKESSTLNETIKGAAGESAGNQHVPVSLENIPVSVQPSIFTLSDLAASKSDSNMFELPVLPSKGNESLGDAGGLRPASSASKSETRIDFAELKVTGFPLRKSSSGSTDLLQDSSTVASRMSPAPSEVSKTESALFSPPSDLSHTESIRHSRQLGRIEEIVNREPINHLTVLEVKKKTGYVCPPKIKKETMQSSGDQPEITCIKKRNVEAKPWYDLSDDEDVLTPERLQKNRIRLRSSSEEEEHSFLQSM